MPIFAMALGIEPTPITEESNRLDAFLNTELLGIVGFWSSAFPLTSKSIANYVSVFGPIFAGITFLKIRTTMTIDPAQYEDMTYTKYLALLTCSALFLSGFIYIFYVGSTDLATHTLKWGILGRNLACYTLFSSGLLFVFQCLPLLIYTAFFYIPRLLIRRRALR